MAAGFVFLNHATGQRISGGLLWQLGGYGHEAVIVFFVLSGFVIGYTTDTREQSGATYAIARISRIYSVALPALLVTFILDFTAQSFDQSLYSAAFGFNAGGKVWQLLAGLFFTNELWGYHIPQGSNWSYWSLGYEVWYYVLFGIMLFSTGWPRVTGVLLIATLVGPKICLMFPIWLLGLGCYRLCSWTIIHPIIGLLLFFASLFGGYGYGLWVKHMRLVSDPAITGDLTKDYVIAILCFTNIIGFRSLSVWLPSTENTFTSIIRWLAGATFSLYLFHEPLLRFLATFSPFTLGSFEQRCMVLGGTIAGVFLAAELTERRKVIWRRGVTLAFASVAGTLRR